VSNSHHTVQRDAVSGGLVLQFSETSSAQTARLSVRVNGFASVDWQPSQATVLAEEPQTDLAVQAVLAFQQRHELLQSLRLPLLELEQQAVADVPLCYRITQQDRQQWPRLQALMHQLAGNRLHIARLYSQLETEPSDLPPPASKLLRKLSKAAGLQTQLQQISDRYEALEDLYEGAIDRINDHRYWRDGHVLEVIIIVVLVAEALLFLR
jgi:hypothetical protein